MGRLYLKVDYAIYASGAIAKLLGTLSAIAHIV